MTPLWPTQIADIQAVNAAIERGVRRVCLVRPTGMGKSRTVTELVEGWLDEGKRNRVSIYTNRRLLVEQLSRVFEAAGVTHGVRAADYEDQRWRAVQISSIQTEASRVLKRKKWELHDATRVVIDEAHLHGGDTARQIMGLHHSTGAFILGVTATPLGLNGLYDELVGNGHVSEGRSCGALVLCRHYGVEEPDLAAFKKARKVKAAEGEDLSENEVRAVMGKVTNGQPDQRAKRLFGSVLDHFERLNPEHKPTILFAPGVAESLWFAEQFMKHGITAAHIDGEDVWIDGEFYESNNDVRQSVLEGSKSGRIKVLCNRFVLREGIDCPWLAHGILATVFGSLQSYLQSGGRLLRSAPALAFVTIQDHGGNWHRHGSLNADRDWTLELTDSICAGLRAKRLREKTEREPFVCAQCKLVLIAGKCPGCGFEPSRLKRTRPVVQMDGTLVDVEGDIYKPRIEREYPNTLALWKRKYFAAKKGKSRMTFAQAIGWFVTEHHYWPPRTLPYMPVDQFDYFRRVCDVPYERLVPDPDWENAQHDPRPIH